MKEDPQIRIAPLASADLDLILNIERSSFSDPWSRNLLREELENPHGTAFGAWTHTGLAGYILLRRLFDEWTVMNIAVHPSRREKGIASALLLFAVDRARELGMSRLTLEVNERNDAAKNLYAAHGFQVVGYRPRYYDKGRSGAVIMDLYLDPA